METKDVLINLREKYHMTQDEMAEKLFITRQAISRWEKGETVPNIETLKLISKKFNVSINTLLGTPQKLVCQCCGAELTDENTSREADGAFNEDFCKWCYVDGKIIYNSIDDLISFFAPQMAQMMNKNEKEVRLMLKEKFSRLNHWKKEAV